LKQLVGPIRHSDFNNLQCQTYLTALVIIASSIDEKLRYALSEIPHATAMIYKLNFTLEQSN
jgi:hypothetical protein